MTHRQLLGATVTESLELNYTICGGIFTEKKLAPCLMTW